MGVSTEVSRPLPGAWKSSGDAGDRPEPFYLPMILPKNCLSDSKTGDLPEAQKS